MSKLQVDDIVNKGDNGAPGFGKGAIVTGVATATHFSGNLTGTAVTATTFSGALTGAATGLSGTPDITVRNITGVGATFSGDVNISGTLAYEDVTNIDSVGLITARAGISVLGAGVTVAGIATFHNGADFNSLLTETVKINTTARTGTQAVNLDDGMVHYFTSSSTGTWKPNFTLSTTPDINDTISTGDTFSVTMIVNKSNTAHYADTIQVDGSDVTPEWLGGAPTEGGDNNTFDVYSYTIIKTGDNAFKCFASVSNYT